MKKIQDLLEPWKTSLEDLQDFFSPENEKKMMDLQIVNETVIAQVNEKRKILTKTLSDGLGHAEQCFKNK